MNKNEIQKRKAAASKHKHTSTSQASQSESFSSLLFSSLFGVGIGYTSLLLTFVVLSFICMFLKAPHPFILPLALFAILLSFVCAGFGALIKSNRASPFLTAICTGLLFMLTLKAISLLFGVITQSEPSLIYKIFGYMTPIFCLPSAVWASKPQKIKHKRHR